MKKTVDADYIEPFYLSEKMTKYVLDYNGASKGTGFCKGATINPSIARTISVRGGSGIERAGVSNFVCEALPIDTPVEKVRELIWGTEE